MDTYASSWPAPRETPMAYQFIAWCKAKVAWCKEKENHPAISSVVKDVLLLIAAVGLLVYTAHYSPAFVDFIKAHWIPTVTLLGITAVALAALWAKDKVDGTATILKVTFCAVFAIFVVTCLYSFFQQRPDEFFRNDFVNFWKDHYVDILKASITSLSITAFIYIVNSVKQSSEKRLAILTIGLGITFYALAFPYNEIMTQFICGSPIAFALGSASGIALAAFMAKTLDKARKEREVQPQPAPAPQPQPAPAPIPSRPSPTPAPHVFQWDNDPFRVSLDPIAPAPATIQSPIVVPPIGAPTPPPAQVPTIRDIFGGPMKQPAIKAATTTLTGDKPPEVIIRVDATRVDYKGSQRDDKWREDDKKNDPTHNDAEVAARLAAEMNRGRRGTGRGQHRQDHAGIRAQYRQGLRVKR